MTGVGSIGTKIPTLIWLHIFGRQQDLPRHMHGCTSREVIGVLVVGVEAEVDSKQGSGALITDCSRASGGT